MQIIPVHTRILTENDDLVAVLRELVVPHIRNDDGIVIASKVISIMQGRVIRPDHVPLGRLARYGARFFPVEGSLSSPHSLQAVVNEVGGLRIMIAFVVAGAGKLFLRRSGDFYRVAGISARAIDDVSTNPPPYDKHIVLAPHRPQNVAEMVKRTLGYDCVIVDANDIGKADIMGSTYGANGANPPGLHDALKQNPCGNGHEQQPFAIIRR